MLEGVVNVLKPPGLTSSDVVTDIRHIFSIKRVGHTGTLDPGASGVLPICIGRATRLFPYLVDKEKEYICEIRFGTATDTQDSYGRITNSLNQVVTEYEFRQLLTQYEGEQEQIAPAYSAVKQDGKKLYELARSGKEIPVKVRRVNIRKLKLLDVRKTNAFLFQLTCSKGTYVRTLCHNMGQSINVPAYMSFLLRTRSGMFEIGNAHTIEELKTLKEEKSLSSAVIPMDEALSHLPELRVFASERQERLLKNGAPVDYAGVAPNTFYRLYCNGTFLGIAKQDENGVRVCANLYADDEG